MSAGEMRQVVLIFKQNPNRIDSDGPCHVVLGDKLPGRAGIF